MPTINYLLSKNCKIIILSHLGRIKTEEDKVGKSLAIVSERLSLLLEKDVIFIEHTQGIDVNIAVNRSKNQDIIMLQNTRFEDFPGNRESGNDPELAKYWASLADVFVNNAFGTCHRNHASNVGISKFSKESCLGLLVEKEIKLLSKAINDPRKPLISIIGGAKVSDKIDIILNLLTKSDKVLIGGAMCYTFLVAKSIEVGTSLVEKDKVKLAKQIINKAKDKLVLPLDHAMSLKFKNSVPIISKGQAIDANKMALDIGPQTIKYYSEILSKAKTIIWNGPMGVFEMSNYKKGTLAICKEIANLKNVYSVIGGGDSAAAAINLGFEDKFSHISTGGGASLEFIEGKKLPGIEAIQDK